MGKQTSDSAAQRYSRSLITAFALLFCLSQKTLAVEAKPLNLVAEVFGSKQIVISPDQYPAEVTAEFQTLTPEAQSEFLQLRQEKLSTLLKSFKGRLLEVDEATEVRNGWLTKKAATLISTIDALLFRNSRLLTAPGRDKGTLYTAQAVAYWGFGRRVKGLGFEVSLLRERTLEGKIKTTISLDSIKILRAYVPLPVASATFRVIGFNSLDFGPDEMETVNIDHLPFGPVTSTGQNHLGLGFGSGIAFPPFPFGTITGFTATRDKRRVLWSCERLLSGS